MKQKAPQKTAAESTASPGERIAKRMARAGLCSRRDAERWIEDGRVKVNGKLLKTPACVVTDRDRIEVDGEPLPGKERSRLWLYHKKSGLVTTAKDPEGRTTVFQSLPDDLPRVLSVGRLDINTEGLLLLTNDGGLKRQMELPATGIPRTYRARAFGDVRQEQLEALAEGVEIDGIRYGSIDANLEHGGSGKNNWIEMTITEGKNREVRRVLEYLGLKVNRLIRTAYGPFLLGELGRGQAARIRKGDLDRFVSSLKKGKR